jgi:L-aspartate oxidase
VESFQHHCDVLIIGSGAAGLSLALQLPLDLQVSVLSKSTLTEGATRYAQGGVSVVLHEDDSVASHVADTLEAGAGLCDAGRVRFIAERAAECINWLIELGVQFTRTRGADGRLQYHLTREGGHSHRRVIHAADATGDAIENTLAEQVCSRANVEVFESHLALDVITSRKVGRASNRCLGAYVYDRSTCTVKVFRARMVVLAAGGAGKVYLYTSNPDLATGDGIAIAWRAGCRVANMEFIQFHPTCLYHPQAKSFLITEAVRGEGGRLVLPDGERFMSRYDSRLELAPRDVVARAIDNEMKSRGLDCVLLDISHRPHSFIVERFPNVYARCKALGYDMVEQPLPVVPAAHYICGGVLTDQHACTDLAGLLAVGEVAFTGVHGANRMASNSLLECLVFAASASRYIAENISQVAAPPELPEWDESRVTDSDEEVVVSHNWDELRRFMWDYVGIVRTTKRLQRARRRVDMLRQEIDEYYGNFRVTNDLIELRNLALVAELIIRSALFRKESRGLHYTLDYPTPNDAEAAHNTVLTP